MLLRTRADDADRDGRPGRFAHAIRHRWCTRPGKVDGLLPFDATIKAYADGTKQYEFNLETNRIDSRDVDASGGAIARLFDRITVHEGILAATTTVTDGTV